MQRRALSLPPKEALAFAKLEIQRAPEVVNDTELFAPVFRNLSIFKRYILFKKDTNALKPKFNTNVCHLVLGAMSLWKLF